MVAKCTPACIQYEYAQKAVMYTRRPPIYRWQLRHAKHESRIVFRWSSEEFSYLFSFLFCFGRQDNSAWFFALKGAGDSCQGKQNGVQRRHFSENKRRKRRVSVSREEARSFNPACAYTDEELGSFSVAVLLAQCLHGIVRALNM